MTDQFTYLKQQIDCLRSRVDTLERTVLDAQGQIFRLKLKNMPDDRDRLKAIGDLLDNGL